MTNIAIIFAGGVGERLNGAKENEIPKQFLEINGKPIIVHTLLNFQNHKNIDKIYIAMLSEYKEYMWELVQKYDLDKVCAIVDGGAVAQESIYNALKHAEAENPHHSIVLIHDGVRPIVPEDVIKRNIECAEKHGNAITCIPAYETTIISKDGDTVDSAPFRKDIYIAQAPQAFVLGEIITAHQKIQKRPEGYENMVDNCTIYNHLGIVTHLVRGNFGNIKITTSEDVHVLKGLMAAVEDATNVANIKERKAAL